MSKSKRSGKWFEDRLREALKSLQGQQGLYFHRLKDSHAAGQVIGNSPADFLVAFKGNCQLWEAKSSEIHPSLRSCLSSMVDGGQIGHHRLWNLNGLASWFIFYSDLVGQVEIWAGQDIVKAREEGKPLQKEQVTWTGPLSDMQGQLLNLLTPLNPGEKR